MLCPSPLWRQPRRPCDFVSAVVFATPLERFIPLTATPESKRYYFNVCGELSYNCTQNDATGCQVDAAGGDLHFSLGVITNGTFRDSPLGMQLPISLASGALRAVAQGTCTPMSTLRSMRLHLICAPEGPDLGVGNEFGGSPGQALCEYSFAAFSRHACPTIKPPLP
eukprot:gene8853-1586_t